MRASFGDGKVAPELVARKEAVALGRLNESVPPSPFVVRFVDAGSVRVGGEPVTPWTAIEYVHGGIEGTTLEDRVTYSLHKTGYAFEPSRAAHAIRCLASGLSAIHAAGIIHRDLSPGNVLCCGFGETEIFKISDFGVARATGLELSFEGLNLGTLGYSAPESSNTTAGPHSDVFSFATVVFYLLTGQHYFDADTPMEASRLFMSESPPAFPRTPRCVRSCSSVPRRARPSMLRSPAQPPGPLRSARRPPSNSAPRSCLGSVRRPRVPSRANDSCRPYAGLALRLRGVSTNGASEAVRAMTSQFAARRGTLTVVPSRSR